MFRGNCTPQETPEFALNLPITMAPAARRTLALALYVTLGQALRLGPQIFSRRAALAQGAALAVTPLAIPLRPALADVYGANSELPTDLKGINKFLKTQGMKEAKTIEHKAERGKADWRLADTNF